MSVLFVNTKCRLESYLRFNQNLTTPPLLAYHDRLHIHLALFRAAITAKRKVDPARRSGLFILFSALRNEVNAICDL